MGVVGGGDAACAAAVIGSHQSTAILAASLPGSVQTCLRARHFPSGGRTTGGKDNENGEREQLDLVKAK